MRRLSVLLLALASVQTFAQETRGAYVGFGYDQISYDNTIYRIDFDDTLLSPKLVGGFRFNDSLSFEASYGESEDLDVIKTGDIFPPFTSPIGPIGGPITAHFEGNFDLVQARVISHQGHVLLGIGFFAADSDLSVEGSSQDYGPFANSFQERESGISIFLGLQWDVGHWGIRGEYSYFDMDGDVAASAFGAGFHYRFQ